MANGALARVPHLAFALPMRLPFWILIRLGQQQIIDADKVINRTGIFPDERKRQLMGTSTQWN
jgi:hypothetical protein